MKSPARAINLHNFEMEGRTGRAQVHNSPQQVEIPHRGPESTEINTSLSAAHLATLRGLRDRATRPGVCRICGELLCDAL